MSNISANLVQPLKLTDYGNNNKYGGVSTHPAGRLPMLRLLVVGSYGICACLTLHKAKKWLIMRLF